MSTQAKPKTALSLKDAVDVVVSVGGVYAARSGYNIGLIAGSSTVLTSAERIKKYAGLAEMTDDGFTASAPEYLAAAKYFAQTPSPKYVLIGWKAADETWLEAVTALCAASGEWYALYACGAEKADIASIAGYIETQENHVFFYDTADSDALSGADGNVFATLKALNYARTLGLYSSDSYAGAALMGYAMGANTGKVDSAYTLKFKSLSGIAPDTLTSAQVDKAKGDNGNVYVTRGESYNGVENGVMANGSFFDQRLGVDQLAYNIQMAVSDLLYTGRTKVPQTEAGMTRIKTVIDAECAKAVATGYLAPGVWTEAPVLDLETGDMLATGYLVQSEPIDGQTAQQRASRTAPPIYVCLHEAGAIHCVAISVLVNN